MIGRFYLNLWIIFTLKPQTPGAYTTWRSDPGQAARYSAFSGIKGPSRRTEVDEWETTVTAPGDITVRRSFEKLPDIE